VEDVKGVESHRWLLLFCMMTKCYLSSVYEWPDMFKNGCTSVTSAECSGDLSTSTSDEKQEQTRAMIFVKKIMEIRDTETPLDISQG
jgi:hypothetical protein